MLFDLRADMGKKKVYIFAIWAIVVLIEIARLILSTLLTNIFEITTVDAKMFVDIFIVIFLGNIGVYLYLKFSTFLDSDKTNHRKYL